MSAAGEIVGLLRLLREHPDAVEADLSRWYGIDYRDRWRFDADGVRRLTLRMIWVRLKHLPPESAVATIARGGKPAWDLTHSLLDDLRMSAEQMFVAEHKVRARKVAPHPERPRKRSKPVTPARQRKLADARRRARDRRQSNEGRDHA